MKKSMLVFILLILAASISRSIEISPIASFGFSKYITSDWISESKLLFRPSIALGGELNFDLSNNIKLTSGLHLALRGSKVRIEYMPKDVISGNYKTSEISLPIHFKLSLGKNWIPYILGGPEIYMVLSHKLVLDNEETFELMEKTNSLGIGVEIGIGIPFKLLQKQCFIEFLYSHGLSNSFDEEHANHISQSAIKLIFGMVLKKNEAEH